MLIGIVGKIGAGKNEVARIVQELYPDMNWQERGFADKLRQVASLLTGIPAEDMKRQEVKEQFLGPEWDDVETKLISGNTHRYPITLRTLLQRLGTEAIRDGLNKNSWCNALMADYKANCDTDGCKWSDVMIPTVLELGIELSYPNWLITDCRFPNELEAITSRGGICIRIVRPDNPHPQSNHENETALDGVELLTIINDGSLEQLRIKVKEVFDPIVDRIRAGSIS